MLHVSIVHLVLRYIVCNLLELLMQEENCILMHYPLYCTLWPEADIVFK